MPKAREMKPEAPVESKIKTDDPDVRLSPQAQTLVAAARKEMSGSSYSVCGEPEQYALYKYTLQSGMVYFEQITQGPAGGPFIIRVLVEENGDIVPESLDWNKSAIAA